MTSISIIVALIALTIGALIGWFLRKQTAAKLASGIEAKAEKLLKEAKAKEQEILLQAREKAITLLDKAKDEEETLKKELRVEKQRLTEREAIFDKKLLELEDKQSKLQEKLGQVEGVKKEIENIRAQQIEKLQGIAGLTRAQATEELMRKVEVESQDQLMARVRKLEEINQEELERKARTIVSTAVQRIATSHAADINTSVVPLPSDEMKGRIIGKEGRNIKTIERLTGVDVIIDETPNALTISGFSPIRRQVAKRAIEKLIADGRIHPARIEETVELAKHDLAVDIRKAGEDAMYEMGIPVASVDPKMVSVLGRLKYRTSYGQNVLVHAQEVGWVAALLAEELGADVAICKKGGLFHDIGKAIDQDIKGAHPQLGYELMKKFNFPEEVAYMSIAHHEDNPKTLEGIIVKAADAISGSRPGARRESAEQYIKRLEDLEKIATSHDGVEKAYAIQAGRELRVFVTPEKMDDLGAYELAKNIARRVEAELQYPGEVKVNVIRETRVVEYAR
ncbi:ribonuclease Y [Candidatus Uhrbacteria bacterium RIFCSPHIGHO2_12_FULL_47_11]|nr:MAG: ribonuclease Y [Candidatus Uhrbacteria bacterium RIFCSPHIGHO2_01_FULL_47_11]OGL68201.1 MAG: ribonuclease Y [Candidatus Uhrbacteria bacterium RIFCSPHIGHO2_02_FULL_46_47]OGL76042.1 MAG: ribonuclease Y [Candidatus Uhrbacteria bacterium RIFCSPHIGHO2_12_FULL_47_11]OGL83839.1 MAG: ribonuclease Y [Candidatus Uhrbacteria bacterium RIFCSPLOWO2_02_FULL_46_25]OGL92382.1 MAG: ribonuclease Y [Candidatus Uhrbacteria bacterium RIFCSPLOWO2_12_FULL_47_10]